jgi:hypothetical protein
LCVGSGHCGTEEEGGVLWEVYASQYQLCSSW